ncbi:PLD nuclease N-terminal domain-containing protein [Microbacterium rhizosphaerae]|uniref:PLD nuclease N-terminal domain-containing protein n=1 Tax=Microbacterium rhizosphaerae TaxID=1678237 RepID=A0ABZ0SIB2_9MICO|nr:PLD nuclease N-terminal domain-containing protein [Microbacterium rhizosphaerae]WPR88554.1 PLD nuclease N-terminal domain-containing protein [Microbacterium rhizosphaerae]
MTSGAKKFSELSRGRQAGIAVGAVVQLALAVWAYVDLARRAPSEVRGRKGLWVPVILVNWIGPAAYFVFGRRR